MKRKQIRLTITLLGRDDEGEKFVFVDDANQLSATGLRVQCNMQFGFGAVMPTAQIRIYGLALDKMTKLLRIRWNTLEALNNVVKVEVGIDGEMHTEFEGNITFASPDLSAIPDVCLLLETQAAAYDSKKPVLSYQRKGIVDLADIFEAICGDMGFQFENNGVSIKTENMTLNGSNLEKLAALSDRYPIDMYIENKIIAITNQGEPRNLMIPIISPKSGLIGYPTPDVKGITFQCFYDPMLRFGGMCRMQDSLIDVCNGEWRIYGLSKNLDANLPNGNWYCDVAATWRNN